MSVMTPVHVPAADVAFPPARDRWGWLLVGLWLLACVWLVAQRWPGIAAGALPDTDDNLRLLQVRDWLAGQGWFDLRQYRLDPPLGADIHWSRLADLPLALVTVLARPFAGAAAETVAAALAPLLTLLAAMTLAARIVRVTVAPGAWGWGAGLLLMAGPAVGMLSPLRIDHHGWQIVALLALVAGLVDPERRRGGIVAGLAVAASLSVGVELLPFLGLGLGLAALGWAVDLREDERLRACCVAAGAGSLAGLLLFVPSGARLARCDALSTAYLLPLLAGSGMLVAATLVARSAGQRIAGLASAALVTGGVLMVGSGGACLLDPYAAIDPDARKLWLSIVNESLPLTRQPLEIALATLALPATGLAGALTMLRHAEDRRPWAVLAAFAAAAILLTLAQTRVGVAAQVLALPGAAALGWHGRRRLAASRSLLTRVLGSVALFLAVSAILPRIAAALLFAEEPTPAEEAAEKVNAACLAPAAIAKLNALPAGAALAPLDFTPALLVHSRHAGLAGPYHRNGAAIADLMQAFGGPPAGAEAIVRRHRIRYVLLCGSPAEGDVYRRRAAHGLYAALAAGRPPAWLTPVAVADTPWRAWAVRD